jgi:hypothetical protein
VRIGIPRYISCKGRLRNAALKSANSAAESRKKLCVSFRFVDLTCWMMPLYIGLFSMPQKSSNRRRSMGQKISALREIVKSRRLPWSFLPDSFRKSLGATDSTDSCPVADPSEVHAIILDAHRSLRAHNPLRSWRLLANWIKSRGKRPEDYAWLTSRIADWNDARIAIRLTQERVARLLALERGGEALKVAADRMALDSRFRPRSAADTLVLAQLAARHSAMRPLAAILLSDFALRFKGDLRTALAEKLRQRLSSGKSALSRPRTDSDKGIAERPPTLKPDPGPQCVHGSADSRVGTTPLVKTNFSRWSRLAA